MRRLLIALLGLLTAGAVTAGTVDIRFDHPESYSDSGDNVHDAAQVREQLAAHLRKLGEAWLPPGQQLKIEILDIDLAGQVRPLRRLARDVRVLRGRADWPRISLRYTLLAGPEVLARGEEVVADMSYLERTSSIDRNESLGYEKRMLERWFRERFAPARH